MYPATFRANESQLQSKIVNKALKIQDFIYAAILALRNWINWIVYCNFNHHFKVNNLISL